MKKGFQEKQQGKHEQEEHCGCAMCQLEGIIGSKKHEHSHDDCGCEHHHEHDCEHHHEHDCEHHHEHDCEHHHEHDCSCEHHHEHDCGCEHHHEHDCGCEHHHEHDCGCEHHHEHDCGCEHHHEHDCEHHHEHDCGCEHHHEHDCGCEHHHEHDCEHHHEHDCGCEHHHEHDCGCEHHHEHDCEHHHEHDCGCEHHHEHDCDDDCGCAMCQLKDIGSKKHEHDHDGCGCAMCQLENPSAASETDDTPSQNKKSKLIGKILLVAAAFVCGELLEVPLAVSFLVSLATIFAWGFDLLKKGFRSLRRLSLDENVLMSIAVVAAFALGEFFEAVMVVVLYSIGEMLEDKAVQKSRRDISEVVNIRPQKANLLLPDGSTQEISSARIRPGDSLLLRVGDRVPVDAKVIEGESSMDQSALTGEAIAVGVRAGDTVLSGSVNLSGVLKIQAQSAFEDSTASRMIRLVEESSAQKGQTEKLITRFAKIYTPIVVLCAVLVAFVPPLLGVGGLKDWIMRSLVFLVASCPCALVISVPLGLYSGVGAISKQGVLVKGSKFLEPLSKAETIVLDKTGTLTTGELEVSQAEALDKADQPLFEELTALAESYSSHPIAQAVLKALPAPSKEDVSDVKEIAGKGIQMLYRGKKLLCGSARLLSDDGLDISSLPKANVYTAYDNKVLGYVILSDRPREEAAQAVSQWKQAGISQTIMLTGDSALSAQRVKEKCGIDQIYTDLLPQDKLTKLNELKNSGKTVIFVGDGINDAPVLAAADVGIAMGLGTDAAIEAADAVLMSEKLTSLTNAVKISRRALSVVHFNIWFILIIKLVVFALGIAGIANMWMAVFADVGVSILTVLNAVRILRFRS